MTSCTAPSSDDPGRRRERARSPAGSSTGVPRRAHRPLLLQPVPSGSDSTAPAASVTEAEPVDRAVLRSDALTVRSAPFADLSDLPAEPVTYGEVGPPLFELEADAAAVVCDRQRPEPRVRRHAFVLGTHVRAQFRLRFERPTDNDGSQDLALFFLTDSNTGILTPELS